MPSFSQKKGGLQYDNAVTPKLSLIGL